MNVARNVALTLALTLGGCGAAPTRESDTLSDIRPLTTGFASVGEARLSGDDRWAILRATPPGERQPAVYVAPLRGTTLGAPVRITPPGTTSLGGTFSPDANSIVFSSSARGERSPTTVPTRASLSLFRADGWQSAMAVTERNVGFDFAKHPITDDADARNVDATFTPDGKWLIFASDRDSASGRHLWAMRADGSKLQQLTFAVGTDGGPAISPDGKRLCFASDRAGDGRFQLMLADVIVTDDRLGLEKERPLTQNVDVNWSACWHPSGKYLLFTAAAAGQARGADELYLIRDDGYRRCRITFTPGFDGLPTFARDGNSILWSSGRGADGSTQLFRAEFRLPDYVKNPDWKKRG